MKAPHLPHPRGEPHPPGCACGHAKHHREAPSLDLAAAAWPERDRDALREGRGGGAGGAGGVLQQRVDRQALGHRLDRLPVRGDPTRASHAGRTLPAGVRAKMEQALKADFSSVRIHEGPQAESVDALAFTRGEAIHFAPGQFDPASRPGQRLLAHELAHVVQQRAGRVAVPRGMSVPINADPKLEAEAERLGDRAAGTAAPAPAAAGAPNPLAAASVQRKRQPQPPAGVQRKPAAALQRKGVGAIQRAAAGTSATRATPPGAQHRHRQAAAAVQRKPAGALQRAPDVAAAEVGDEAATPADKRSRLLRRQRLMGGLGVAGGIAGIAGGLLTANPVLLGLGAAGLFKGASTLWKSRTLANRQAAGKPGAGQVSATPSPSPCPTEEAQVPATPPPASQDVPPAAAEETAPPAPEPAEAQAHEHPEHDAPEPAPVAEPAPAEEQDTGPQELQADLSLRSSGRIPAPGSRRAKNRASRREARGRRRAVREKARSKRHFQQARDRLERRSRRDRTHAQIASSRSRRAPRRPPVSPAPSGLTE